MKAATKSFFSGRPFEVGTLEGTSSGDKSPLMNCNHFQFRKLVELKEQVHATCPSKSFVGIVPKTSVLSVCRLLCFSEIIINVNYFFVLQCVFSVSTTDFISTPACRRSHEIYKLRIYIMYIYIMTNIYFFYLFQAETCSVLLGQPK